MTTTVHSPARSRARVGNRLLSIALATAASLAVWLVAALTGTELSVTSPLVGTLPIDAPTTAIAALALSAAAWGVLALLERRTPRARPIWTIVAVAVLVVSLLPLPFLEASVGTRLALGAMHLASGLALILLLRRGARSS